ncbi:hypothetical protein [Burkholderia vietnamiensis]|uniref:hypothetical protein n=1 Tax=Burkholderia vietnamiensis TaxID=60552 RepID=UPI001FC8111C|nr:hypothetical protein [Burkholderia vietnamiensis]
MSVQNDFLAFAVGAGANVLGQADYAGSTTLAQGFVAGTASAKTMNKAIRQSSIMSAVLSQFIVNRTSQPVIDDGTTATILANFIAAIESMISAATAPAPGDIKIWAGAVADIPTRFGPGWYLANGANGTINLTDKFIVGAGNTYAVGAAGGNASVTIDVAHMPSHSHATMENPHSHGTTENPHSHGTTENPHSHANGVYTRLLRPPYVGSMTGSDTDGSGSEQSVGAHDSADIVSSVTGLTVNSASTGIRVNSASTGISVGNTGGGQAIDIRPPYYALCFVQYVGTH